MSLHTCADNRNLCNVGVTGDGSVIAYKSELSYSVYCYGSIVFRNGEGNVFCIVPADGLKNNIYVYVFSGKLAEYFKSNAGYVGKTDY